MSIHTATASLATTLTASISVRFVVVGALFLLSMIPLALVGSVVGDREAYFDEAIDGIEQSWAGSQRLAGPLLLIPRLDEDGGDAGHVALMPETLDLRVDSRHEMRQRGIFEAPVFHLDATAVGAFPALDAAKPADPLRATARGPGDLGHRASQTRAVSATPSSPGSTGHSPSALTRSVRSAAC